MSISRRGVRLRLRSLRQESTDRCHDLRALLKRLPIERFRHPPPVVAVVPLAGIIGRLGPWQRGLSMAGLAGTLERAFKLDDLKAVAIVVNSPGGSPVQSALIARRIRALADEHKVPVYRLRRGRGGLGRLLAAERRRRDLRRRKLDRRLDRGDLGRLRLRRGAAAARHRAPRLHRRRAQGLARSVPAGAPGRGRAPQAHPGRRPRGLPPPGPRAPAGQAEGRRKRNCSAAASGPGAARSSWG